MLKKSRKMILNNPPSPPNPWVSPTHLWGSRVLDAALEPSGRGELEITDVNNYYIEQGRMGFRVLDGYWSDAGTFGSLLRAGMIVNKHREKKEGTTDKHR